MERTKRSFLQPLGLKQGQFKKRGERSADSLVRANFALHTRTRGQGFPRSVLESALGLKDAIPFGIEKAQILWRRTNGRSLGDGVFSSIGWGQAQKQFLQALNAGRFG